MVLFRVYISSVGMYGYLCTLYYKVQQYSTKEYLSTTLDQIYVTQSLAVSNYRTNAYYINIESTCSDRKNLFRVRKYVFGGQIHRETK